jgi:hypothetical protein
LYLIHHHHHLHHHLHYRHIHPPLPSCRSFHITSSYCGESHLSSMNMAPSTVLHDMSKVLSCCAYIFIVAVSTSVSLGCFLSLTNKAIHLSTTFIRVDSYSTADTHGHCCGCS